MVEHDQALIRSADHVIEMGPGAGERGGRVVFAGPKQEFLEEFLPHGQVSVGRGDDPGAGQKAEGGAEVPGDPGRFRRTT